MAVRCTSTWRELRYVTSGRVLSARALEVHNFGQEFGVRCVEVESDARGGDGVPLYDAACAEQALKLVLGGICD